MSNNPTAQAPTIHLTKSELIQAVGAYAKKLPKEPNPLGCCRNVRIGVFFDGTNNNMRRDEADSPKCHSNIVRLFKAYVDAPDEAYFRYYIPGVGTIFDEVGEPTESADGKAYGKGGAARIHWALIQVLNSVHFAVHAQQLVPDVEATAAITSEKALKESWSLFSSKRRTWFGQQISKLESAIKNQKPTITSIEVSVFGFSRGAAEARAFCHWLLDCCKDGKLAGSPLTINFLGLFDTVASVGLADSFPLPVDGHFDWADGTMRIPEAVARAVHLVAAHEIRASFPLNCARDGKAYVGDVLEVVYPGAHSNVGGGYGAGEQKRSQAGDSALLSQLPLARMYQEACKAGVPLLPFDGEGGMKPADQPDFEIDSEMLKAFNTYLLHTGVKPGKVEDMLEAHMRYYRRYKAAASKWEAVPQDPADQAEQDIKEARSDYERERAKLLRKEQLSKQVRHGKGDSQPMAMLTTRDKELLEDLRSTVPSELVDFLDEYVHDSHAGFYLAGPVTAYDKQQEIKRIEKMVEDKQTLNRWEQKVWDAKQQGRKFPVMTDEDQWDMLRGGQVVVRVATSTRREGTGYFRQRVVFDKS
ncbi:T6SS phospholipase effector Tle1-like catalytic domain-containing protein [Chitinimonas sp. PSY-7]|uniref:phospholipase effector Tle1 domain-containing protein n=1 Tax=Chitinimonas sp. PSY-7 TaxID=3459088 RepID=UPI00403FC97C